MCQGRSSSRDGSGFRALWESVPVQARAAVLAVLGGAVVLAWVVSGSASRAQDEAFPSAATETSGEATALPVPDGVIVHVVGAVRRPGVYELPAGSRVADAVEAAGGALGNAAASALNLARLLTDGEQVRVLTTDEASAAAFSGDARGLLPPVGQPKVNINAATVEQLDSLPGIGPATAQKIVEDRMRNGPFRSPEDLMRVPGIGPKKFEVLEELICTG